jgi:hypothetical protein
MNINSNALAHEIAPRCWSLIGSFGPDAGACCFAPNICLAEPYDTLAHRTGASRDRFSRWLVLLAVVPLFVRAIADREYYKTAPQSEPVFSDFQ